MGCFNARIMIYSMFQRKMSVGYWGLACAVSWWTLEAFSSQHRFATS